MDLVSHPQSQSSKGRRCAETSFREGTSGRSRSQLSLGLEFPLQRGSINLLVGDWYLILLLLRGGKGDRLGRSRSQEEKV